MLARGLPSSMSFIWTDVKEIATEVAYGVRTIYDATSFKQPALEWVQGFMQPFNPSTVAAVANSEKAREILWHSAKTNTVTLILPSLIYWGVVKPGMHLAAGEDSYAELAVDLAATTYAIFALANQFHESQASNIVLSKAIADDNKDHSHIKSCECPDGSKSFGFVPANLYFWGNNWQIWKLSWLTSYGSQLASVFLNGQGIVDYKLAAVGNCYQHRQEILLKNNAYAFGMGSSAFMLLQMGRLSVYLFTGVESYLVNKALSNMIYQWCLVSSLAMEKPLPGKIAGIDFFKRSKMHTDADIQFVKGTLLPELNKILSRPSEEDIHEQLMAFFSTPRGRKVKQLLQAYIQKPSVKFFSEAYRPHFEGAYDMFAKIRSAFDGESGYKSQLKYQAGIRLPYAATPAEKMLLKFLQSSDAPPALKVANKTLNALYPGRDNEDLRLDRQGESRQRMIKAENSSSRKTLTEMGDPKKLSSAISNESKDEGLRMRQASRVKF